MKRTLASFAATATVVAVLLALTQTAGRTAMHFLPAFEADLNARLEGIGAQVHGIEGRWNGINPGFAVDRLGFSWGELHEVEFELDLLESLWRNRVVARRLAVASGTVDVEPHGQGWRLRGVMQPLDFDFATLAAYSDEISATMHVRMFDAGEAREIGRLVWLGANFDNRHRLSLSLTPPDTCAQCGLLLEGDVTPGGDGHGRLIASRLAVDALPVLAGAEVNAIGAWRRDGGEGRARIRVGVRNAGGRGEAAELMAQLSAWSVAASQGERYRGRIDRLRLAAGNGSLALEGGFAFDSEAVEVWSRELDVAELARMGGSLLGAHTAAAWLRGLAPTGRLRAVRARATTTGSVAWMAQAEDVAFAGYRGVPVVAGGDARLTGVVGEGAARVAVVAQDDLEIGFTDHFADSWRLQRSAGELTFWAAPGRLHMRGTDIEAATAHVHTHGGFALAHDGAKAETRLLIDGAIDRADVARALPYIPRQLPAGTRNWLRTAPLGGVLRDGRLLWHSRAQPVHGLLSRRFELAASVQDGQVAYAPEWPEAQDIDGRVAISAAGVVVEGAATVFGARLEEAQVQVPPSGDLVRVRFTAEHDAGRLLAFLRAMPEQQRLDFLRDEWSATGNVAVLASLAVPLREQADSSRLEPLVKVELDLKGTDILLADLGLAFEGMAGEVSVQAPDIVHAEGIAGSLFGKAVQVAVSSDDGDGATDHAIRFDVRGTANMVDVAGLLGVEPPAFADGHFGFDAAYIGFPRADRAPELTVQSDLQGLFLDLPTPLGKPAEATADLQLTAHLLQAHSAVNVHYANAPAAAGELALSGWLHVADAGVQRGALGIGHPVPIADATADRVVLAGSLGPVSFSADAIPDLPSWEARELRLERLDLGQFALHELVMSGRATSSTSRRAVSSEGGHLALGGTDRRAGSRIASEIEFAFRSREAEGTLSRSDDAPWQVDLTSIRLPATEGEDEADPLTVAVMDDLQDADVRIHSVFVGQDDYGDWRFGLRKGPEGVALVDLASRVRGLEVAATEPMFWSRATNATNFDGIVRASNVADVLPRWGFAPSVESESFEMEGRLSWPGSPLMFDLAHLSGNADLALDDGSFVEVEVDAAGSGAIRIMSLVNFSTIAKRLSLDFSDVFGDGVSFDEVRVQLALDDGLARFEQPASIAGTGLSFRINGTVNFDTGALDNEMIVTLPLHQSLPWYAAFIALANPAGAVGVLVGGQLLREPLSRLTSGKYRIRGTYDEPEVDFVSIFAEDIGGTAAPEGAEGATPRPADGAFVETSAR